MKRRISVVAMAVSLAFVPALFANEGQQASVKAPYIIPAEFADKVQQAGIHMDHNVDYGINTHDESVRHHQGRCDKERTDRDNHSRKGRRHNRHRNRHSGGHNSGHGNRHGSHH